MADIGGKEEVKARADIVAIIGRYVDLKKAGRTYSGRCPFHNEKTPSFHVNPTLNMFKCFGCGEAGDVISFIQKIEHLDFPQALEKLASEVGVVLKKNNDPAFKRIAEFRKMNEIAANFFHYVLTSHNSGKDALDYALNKRKFTKTLLKKYNIGFAPRGRDVLQKWLMKKGFSKNSIKAAGFINERGNDKFSGRLMFPIVDAAGRIVGFSGRLIEKNDKRPKYLNSAESDLYKKRFLLFGLYHAKNAIQKNDLAIMCEGQIDVIMSQQLGVEHIVAPLGTSMTETQLSLLKKHTKKVAFCFDNDAAGQKSLLRGVKLALESGMHPFIITLPSDVNDIDELISKRPDDWKDRSKNPRDFFEVKLIELKSEVKNNPVAFEQKLSVLIDIVKSADELKQGIIAKQMAEILNLSETAILQRIQAKSRPQQQTFVQEQEVKEEEEISNTSEYVLAMITMFPLLMYFMGTPKEVVPYLESEKHALLYEKLYSFAKKHFSIVESVYSKEKLGLETTWDQVFARYNNECSLDFSKHISTISAENPELASLLEKIMFSEYTANIGISDDVVDDFFKTWIRLKKHAITVRLEKLRAKLSHAETSEADEDIKELEEKASKILLELRSIGKKSIYEA